MQAKALALAPLASARQKEQDALLVAQRDPGLVAIAHEQERLDHAVERVSLRRRPLARDDLDVFRPYRHVGSGAKAQGRARRAATGERAARQRSLERHGDRRALGTID